MSTRKNELVKSIFYALHDAIKIRSSRGVNNPSVGFDLDRYDLLRTGVRGPTSDITNDIGPMIQIKKENHIFVLGKRK